MNPGTNVYSRRQPVIARAMDDAPPPRALRDLPCMKQEMRAWDARKQMERRARQFAVGLVLVLTSVAWMVSVRPALTQYGIGTLIGAVGAVLVLRAVKR